MRDALALKLPPRTTLYVVISHYHLLSPNENPNPTSGPLS